MRVTTITEIIRLPNGDYLASYSPIVIDPPHVPIEHDGIIDPEEPNAQYVRHDLGPMRPIATIRHYGSRAHAIGGNIASLRPYGSTANKS